MSWQRDVLHVNDWHCGLAPAYLRWQGADVPTILTIHNIAYQGLCDRDRMATLGIPERAFHINGVEFHDRVSFLKAGLFYADHVSTVSPTYAREITTDACGAGLHGLMRGIAAEGRLSGIVNGIDETWDPSQDPHLPHHFEADDLSGKQANADLVRTGLCLEHSEGPLFGVVSRRCTRRGWTSSPRPPATSCAKAGRSPSWAWAIPTPSTCSAGWRAAIATTSAC